MKTFILLGISLLVLGVFIGQEKRIRQLGDKNTALVAELLQCSQEEDALQSTVDILTRDLAQKPKEIIVQSKPKVKILAPSEDFIAQDNEISRLAYKLYKAYEACPQLIDK